MVHVRRNVWKLPADDTTLHWYGRAVAALQSRKIDDPTSWWYLGAIHGVDEGLWKDFGFIPRNATVPSTETLQQCQHFTWYFLPWHRGYLAAFEKIVRAAIVKLGGPEDWALPYWDYSDESKARELPRAFAKPKLADGSRNFLYEARRYGSGTAERKQTPIVLDPRDVAVVKTLRESYFEGDASGGSPGFGGVKSAFSHLDGDGTGALEGQPHNVIHNKVGGGDPDAPGLMTNPDTAALDPIFWLHHANIDRLWNVWLRQKARPNDPPDKFKNPTDTDWLDGPRDRDFALPDIDGSIQNFVARDILDTTAPALDYVYDDEAAPSPSADHLAMRFERLGAAASLAATLAGDAVVAPPKPAELLGASSGAVPMNDDAIETTVTLDAAQHRKLSSSLAVNQLAAGPVTEPDRVYLNLENITSPTDAGVLYVYVNLPQGADPATDRDHYAGAVSMFGARKASSPQAGAGNGVNARLDITDIVDRLHVANALGQHLSVTIVSATPGLKDSGISIGRISVYRQGQ